MYFKATTVVQVDSFRIYSLFFQWNFQNIPTLWRLTPIRKLLCRRPGYKSHALSLLPTDGTKHQITDITTQGGFTPGILYTKKMPPSL